jgi:hypothetical protein
MCAASAAVLYGRRKNARRPTANGPASAQLASSLHCRIGAGETGKSIKALAPPAGVLSISEAGKFAIGETGEL